LTHGSRDRIAPFVRLGTLLALVLLLASPAVAENAPLPFLNTIELKPIKGAPKDRFEVRLYHKDPAVLASYLATERSYAITENKEYVAVTSDRYSYPRKTGQIAIKPSFVNDYDLDVFQRIREQVIGTYGAVPSDASLVEFVNKYIEKKNYTRGFDIASQVVGTKEGDCTEHAVLLVSLMRMFKIPAKVVFGLKLLKLGDDYGAYTHAWVEYLQKGKWKAADATLAIAVDRTYIPVGTLENEGMDFVMDLVPVLQMMPYRIEASGI